MTASAAQEQPATAATGERAEPTEMVDASVIAARYRISTRTVQRLVKAGRLPARRVGQQLRFDLDEVDQALKVAA